MARGLRRTLCTYPSKGLFREEMNVLFDGKCALCAAEINFLRKRDTARSTGSRLLFTDIEGPDYDNSDPRNGSGAVSYEAGMKAIHAVRSDGIIIKGVPVFAAAYEEVGLGWIFAFTKYPAVAPIAARVYDFWAYYRTDLTRGKSIQALVEERNAMLEAAALECKATAAASKEAKDAP